MFNDSFTEKRILVTGHTGFKGTWLSLWLQKLGADVYGVSNEASTSPSMFQALQIARTLKHHTLDVRERANIKELVWSIKPDFIFHLAAQALVFDAYEDPAGTFDTNVMGTVSVLDAVREADWNCSVVSITSDKCYENVEWIWGYRESDRLGGSDPYSASKAGAELAIQTYYRSFFAKENSRVRVVATRAGNVIGGGDWSANRIVPDCVKAWSMCSPVVLRRPQATRPWQHVLEPLSGYLNAASHLSRNPQLNGQAFNFGPNANQDKSVLELLEKLKENWFFSSSPFSAFELQPDDSRPEAGLLKLSCDKALASLQWQPAWDFTTTAEKTASWYRKFYDEGASVMTDFTRSQIDAYTLAAQHKGIAWSL
jgi:CDP-glucose 4,6-dehydratase